MARKASVRYWASRGAYCCWIKGTQHTLALGSNDAPNGATYRAALAEFARLTRASSGAPLLAELTRDYLTWHRSYRRPATTRIREHALRAVCKAFGERYVNCLTSYDLETWCASQQTQRGWSDSTAKLILSSVRACLRWAVNKGVITTYPLGSLEMPRDVSRGLECVLTTAQEGLVLQSATPSLRSLVQVLRDTGARPGELIAAETQHYDGALRAIILPAITRPGQASHKNARTGKTRVIYLTAASVAIVERLCELHPTGPLFRSRWPKRGGTHKGSLWGWTPHNLSQAFARLRKCSGVRGLIAYSFRHTYAVRWLREGKPIEALAEVLGTSIGMIQRHYGHLADQRDYLRRLVDDDKGPGAG